MDPTTDGLWMVAHPVRGDDRYSFADNMRHIPHMVRVCIEEGYPAIAPYYELCAALDDSDPSQRAIGRVIQWEALRRCDGIILTGHALSDGVGDEHRFMRHERRPIINVVGLSDALARQELREHRRLLAVSAQQISRVRLLTAFANSACTIFRPDLKPGDLVAARRELADTLRVLEQER